jgi:flagellar secretion chaperone FliS
MSINPYEQARWDAVLGADPVELVVMLYRGATDSVRTARRLLAEGDISGRTRSINRAMEIVVELVNALDRVQDPVLGERLSALYGFVLDSLREGNFRQTDAPLADAQHVLAVLGEAWSQCRTSPQDPAGAGALVSRCA